MYSPHYPTPHTPLPHTPHPTPHFPTPHFPIPFKQDLVSREAQLFVEWVSGSVNYASVGFHASTQPTFYTFKTGFSITPQKPLFADGLNRHRGKSPDEWPRPG